MLKKPLVLYGGAFCPPHLDHSGENSIISLLLRDIASRVLVIPTGFRTDKSYYSVSDTERLDMLHLATGEYGDMVEIDTVCMDGYIDSTTIAQAKYLRREYGYDIPQVFGADVIPHMMKWDKTWFVAHTLPKIFITRPGYEIDPTQVGNYQTVDFASHGFSSTEIRKRIFWVLRDNDPLGDLRHMVNENVLEYILDHHLFVPRKTLVTHT